jgi:glutamine synthetase
MHLHFSTRDASTGQSNFCNGNSLTDLGGSFLEGILSHLPALLGLTLPTVNSFRRVGPGCWTGSAVGWATEDKECGVRVCSDLATCEWRHFELKFIDHTCNIYLAMAAILFAGLQGIENSMTLREPLQKDPSPTPLPLSVFEALDALEKDASLVSLLGPPLTQAYLAVRRHDAERASTMAFSDEVKDFMRRS